MSEKPFDDHEDDDKKTIRICLNNSRDLFTHLIRGESIQVQDTAAINLRLKIELLSSSSQVVSTLILVNIVC